MKKDLEYYKNNAEEDYSQVPISVLRYISELEEAQKQGQTLPLDNVVSSVCSCDNIHGEIETKTNYCWYCLKSIKEQTDL